MAAFGDASHRDFSLMSGQCGTAGKSTAEECNTNIQIVKWMCLIY